MDRLTMTRTEEKEELEIMEGIGVEKSQAFTEFYSLEVPVLEKQPFLPSFKVSLIIRDSGCFVCLKQPHCWWKGVQIWIQARDLGISRFKCKLNFYELSSSWKISSPKLLWVRCKRRTNQRLFFAIEDCSTDQLTWHLNCGVKLWTSKDGQAWTLSRKDMMR